jgi:hypothetical protein
LKPGGHVLAFGGSRTWHRLAVAVEDAGFELRDSIAWLYGSGFPKSLDVSKAIDKSDAREERRSRDLRFTAWMRSTGISARQINDLTSSNMGSHYLTDKEQPAIPTEEMFSLLRPHLPKVPEDIERLVFDRTVESKNFAEREVISEKPAYGIGSNGAAFNGHSEGAVARESLPATSEAKAWEGWGTALKPAFEPVVVGRKPLVGTVAENVLAWGVGGLNIDGSRIPTEQKLGGGSYSTKEGLRPGHIYNSQRNFMKPEDYVQPSGRWPANVILDEVTAGLLDEQSGVLKPATSRTPAKPEASARAIFGGGAAGPLYNDTGGASRFFYVAKASKRDRNEGLDELEAKSHSNYGSIQEFSSNPARQNFHPTVKPTQLMRYLIKLVTPPGGTVLDPFTGSGSTGKAALLDGFDFVGAELTEEYLPIIEGRLRWAIEQEGETDERLF